MGNLLEIFQNIVNLRKRNYTIQMGFLQWRKAGLNAKPLSILFYHFLAFKQQLAGQKKDTQGNAD